MLQLHQNMAKGCKMNLFKLLLFILFAILPIAEHSYTSERTLKVDLSAEEEKILARGWTQQEIKQESDAFCANPTEPEETSAKVEYWRKLFFGSGITEFSRCFRKYTQKYMEKFLSPDGILTGETADIMYAKCWNYKEDLKWINSSKLPITEDIRLHKNFRSPVCALIGRSLDEAQEKFTLDTALDNADFLHITWEYCFWLAMNELIEINYRYPFFDEPNFNTQLLIHALSWFEKDTKAHKKELCCNIL